jgi:DNA-binding XRE family transcriptional regulator
MNRADKTLTLLLKKRRKELKMTQSAAAQALKISRETFSMKEKAGKFKLCELDKVLLLLGLEVLLYDPAIYVADIRLRSEIGRLMEERKEGDCAEGNI